MRQAIILAAGYGTRMVPINVNRSKGLLKVNGEPLIERIIRQLHEVNITNITIVVGYMKEQYDYLVNKYSIHLLDNTHYDTRNNIYSLYLVKEKLRDSYIIPCDIWFKHNPFSKKEKNSWYLFSDKLTNHSHWRISNGLNVYHTDELGNRMIGIAYLNSKDAMTISDRLTSEINNKNYDKYWEDTLSKNNKFLIAGRFIPNSEHAEINSYEELLETDSHSEHLQNKAIQVIEKTLNIDKSDIHNIHTLKKGMTNRSFIFTVKNNRYIMRIPGEGTDKLVDRKEEYDVYQQIKDEPYTETILYLNPKNGYKLSRFLENTRDSNENNWEDVAKCMNLLRMMHSQKFKVKHTFDIWKQIKFYGQLRDIPSKHKDFDVVQKDVFKLKKFIRANIRRWTLCHIDSVADNFLINDEGKVFLIDWEYAGMQDPDLDIAMFAIYVGYNRKQFDKLINIYYQNKCDKITRYKIYGYAAAGGMLWSNWCEYKESLGLDFGAYPIIQYNYAKNYSKLVLNYLRTKS